MKKSISLILAAAMLLCLCLTGCGGKKSLTLNVYNWGEYISDGSEGSFETVREFEKWYEANYGQKVTVNYSTYASNEDMYSKISSGAVSYDVLIPSDYMIQRLVAENRLEKLDFSNIPNYKYIDSLYRDLYFDPSNEYSVPYSFGMVGVIYNTKMVECVF